jgi:hypothetical protein
MILERAHGNQDVQYSTAEVENHRAKMGKPPREAFVISCKRQEQSGGGGIPKNKKGNLVYSLFAAD